MRWTLLIIGLSVGEPGISILREIMYYIGFWIQCLLSVTTCIGVTGFANKETFLVIRPDQKIQSRFNKIVQRPNED